MELYTHNKSVTWKASFSPPGKGATGLRDALGGGGRGRRPSPPPPPPPDRKRMNPKDVELWSPLSSGHASPFLVKGAAWENLLERVR